MSDWSADGTRFVSTSFDGSVVLWDGESGLPLGNLLMPEELFLSAAFLPDGETLSWRRTRTASIAGTRTSTAPSSSAAGEFDAAQGAVLRRWFEENVLPTFADRVLPFDLSAARVLAAFRVPEHAPFDIALIAAVAASAEMTIATRNTRHFKPPGIPCLDPWDTTAPQD